MTDSSRRIALLAVVALGGCATTVDHLQSQTQSGTYVTAKLAQPIADCLQDRFGPVGLVRTGRRAAITSKTGLAIDVFDGGAVRVRQPLPLDGEARRHVEACL